MPRTTRNSSTLRPINPWAGILALAPKPPLPSAPSLLEQDSITTLPLCPPPPYSTTESKVLETDNLNRCCQECCHVCFNECYECARSIPCTRPCFFCYWCWENRYNTLNECCNSCQECCLACPNEFSKTCQECRLDCVQMWDKCGKYDAPCAIQ